MSSLYKDSALSQIGLELQTWLWMLLRKIRTSDSDAGNDGLVPHASPHAAPVPLERLGLSPSGAAATALAFTGASTAGIAARSRMPTSAAVEQATSNPVVILGQVPSASVMPMIIGSSVHPAVAQICGCGYFLAPTRLLDQRAADGTPMQLNGQLYGHGVTGSMLPGGVETATDNSTGQGPTRLLDRRAADGTPVQLNGQLHGEEARRRADLLKPAIMGASISADMSRQNVAPLDRCAA